MIAVCAGVEVSGTERMFGWKPLPAREVVDCARGLIDHGAG